MAKNLLLTCNFCIMCEPNSVFVSQQNLEKKTVEIHLGIFYSQSER